jgi:hypothetical protein
VTTTTTVTTTTMATTPACGCGPSTCWSDARGIGLIDTVRGGSTRRHCHRSLRKSGGTAPRTLSPSIGTARSRGRTSPSDCVDLLPVTPHPMMMMMMLMMMGG